MDQGIIKLFKFHYRKQSLKSIVQYVDQHKKKPTETLNILQAIRFSKVAWTQVTETCIKNCFSRGFDRSTKAATDQNNAELQQAVTDEDRSEMEHLLQQTDMEFAVGKCVLFLLLIWFIIDHKLLCNKNDQPFMAMATT